MIDGLVPRTWRHRMGVGLVVDYRPLLGFRFFFTYIKALRVFFMSS